MVVNELTNKNFKEAINKDRSCVIEFHAFWCSPCKALSPIFKELSNEIKDADFYKVNVDSEQELAREFSIMSIPTVIILKKGKEIARINGFSGRDNLKSTITSKIK